MSFELLVLVFEAFIFEIKTVEIMATYGTTYLALDFAWHFVCC